VLRIEEPQRGATDMAHDRSGNEEKALALLGQGHSASVVSSALGVTDSRVSQMLAAPGFAAEVQRLRVASLQKSTELDSSYNGLEGKLLEKLEKVLPLITRPRDILQAITTINSAKRRGATTTDTDIPQAKVVSLTLPTTIQQKFVTNNYHQVVEVRDDSGEAQTLVTASSGSLPGFLASRELSPQELSRELSGGEGDEGGEQEPKELPEPSGERVTQQRHNESSRSEKETYEPDLLSSL
jgi:hypothetical protein